MTFVASWSIGICGIAMIICVFTLRKSESPVLKIAIEQPTDFCTALTPPCAHQQEDVEEGIVPLFEPTPARGPLLYSIIKTE
jgi:hypothetical protein